MAYPAIPHPSFYYGAPTKPRALYALRFGPIDPIVKFGQGAAAALAAYSGVNNVTGVAGAAPGAPTIADFTTLDGFTQAMLEGRLTGPAQIIAAAFLFLAAGRCTARLVGLAAGLALVYLYLQGATLSEALQLAGDLGDRIAAAAQAFRGAGDAAG